MRRLLAVVCMASATFASFASGAHGESGTVDRQTQYMVEGPWSISITYQLFSPSDADTGTWNDGTSRLSIFEADPSQIELGANNLFLSFAAPAASERPLRAGFYGRAQPRGSSDPTRPEMEFVGLDGLDCERVGSFDIRELQRSDGEIDRLWITFEQRCADFVGPVESGEIRFGMPQAPYAATPTSVTWPDQTFAGSHGAFVEVEVRPLTAPAERVERVSVTGRGREHFEIVSESCSDAAPSTEPCTAAVRFVPEAPGPQRARLRVEVRGDDLMVPLEGSAIPRESVWDLQFEASHPVGSGYPDTPSELRLGSDEVMMFGEATHRRVVFSTQGPGRVDNVAFSAPAGTTLDNGRTYEFGAGSGDAAMHLELEDGECMSEHGQFTVHRLRVTPDEALHPARVTFTHVCDDTIGADGRLVGDLRYRWRPDGQRPTGVTDLELTRKRTGIVGEFDPSADSDVAGVVVRWYPGRTRAPQRPSGAVHARLTSTTAFRLPPRTRDTPVTVAAFAYDHTGNVSRPTVARLR